MDMSGIFAQTNTRELARLITDLSKLHDVLWHWYRNGVTPRPSRLRGTAERDTKKDAEIPSISALDTLMSWSGLIQIV